MTDVNELKKARMSLAQAVTRSLNGDAIADRAAVDEHRDAAEMRLRRAGRDDLGFRVNHDLDAGSTEARRNLREVMQLIDVELEPGLTPSDGFATAATDGGDDE